MPTNTPTATPTGTPFDAGLLKVSAVNGDPLEKILRSGDTVVYTLTFPDPAMNVTFYDLAFADTLPDGLELVAVSFTGGVNGAMNFTPPHRAVGGTFDRLDPLEQIEVTITAVVDADFEFDNGNPIPPAHQFKNMGTFKWHVAPDSDPNRLQYYSESNVDILSLAGIALNPDHVGSASPGTAVSYRHYVRNIDYADDNVTITYPASSEGWTWTWYLTDAAGNISSGPFSSGNTIKNIAAGEIRHLLFRALVPANTAAGARDVLDIKATSVRDGTFFDTARDITVVTDQPSQIQLFKNVDKGNARPGEQLLYTVSFLNMGTSSLSNLIISDPVSAYVMFLYDSFGVGADIELVLPGAGTSYLTAAIDMDEGQYDGGIVTVNLETYQLPAGETGHISYKVMLK
jgi:uncharacterized repeat protein (TIGR01451 family)